LAGLIISLIVRNITAFYKTNMATMIDRFVVKFEKSKKALRSGKIFATYGKWNDKWNINKVLLQCRNKFF
jgi:hypothetical protein